MKKSRYSGDQIAHALRQADGVVAVGDRRRQLRIRARAWSIASAGSGVQKELTKLSRLVREANRVN